MSTGFLGTCTTDVLQPSHRLSPIWARRWAELTDRPLVRLVIYWQNVAKVAPDGTVTLDWTQTRENVDVLRATKLPYYLNLVTIPPYAAGGSTCYQEGLTGCLDWVNPQDASKGLKFVPERGQCSNPPDPDPVAIEYIAGQLVKEFPDAEFYAFGNEPDDRVSSAAIAHTIDLRNGGKYELTARWYVEKFLVPFYRGVKPANPNAKVSGAECSTHGFLVEMIRWQHETGQLAWDWDLTTTHLYAGPPFHFPEDTYEQFQGASGSIRAYLDELRDRDGINIAQVLLSECGDEHRDPEGGDSAVGWPTLILALHARDDVSGLIMLSDALWTPESIRDSDPVKNTYEPSPLYGQIEKMMSRVTSRHRAVKS